MYLDSIPDFGGDVAKEEWYYNNVGPRDNREVIAILEKGFQEARSYGARDRRLKKIMYDELAPSFQRKYDRIVYTDGSFKSSNGMAGYGAWWGKQDGNSTHGPVPMEQSPMNAELYAVYQALICDTNVADAIRIETDCIDVIFVLLQCATGGGTVLPDLCNRIIPVIASRPGPIGFGYVPGHTNVYGNEQADLLAGSAARNAPWTHPGLRN